MYYSLYDQTLISQFAKKHKVSELKDILRKARAFKEHYGAADMDRYATELFLAIEKLDNNS